MSILLISTGPFEDLFSISASCSSINSLYFVCVVNCFCLFWVVGLFCFGCGIRGRDGIIFTVRDVSQPNYRNLRFERGFFLHFAGMQFTPPPPSPPPQHPRYECCDGCLWVPALL